MHTRFTQEVNLACEKKYGSMTRYSPNADHSGQARYEQELHDNMQMPIDISTIEVAPLPSPYPKSRAQMQEERRATQQASRQAAAQTMSSCTDGAKGLRMSIMADKMQQGSTVRRGLSAKERADFEADIKATRDAADKKLDYAPPVDPSKPNRALMRLTSQDQVEMTTEFSNQYLRKCKTVCMRRRLQRENRFIEARRPALEKMVCVQQLLFTSDRHGRASRVRVRGRLLDISKELPN